MVGGATLTKLLGTSAWYAPGASVAYLVDSIVNNQRKMIPCSVYLEGEYNQDDICIGVPCIIGNSGISAIVDVKLNEVEQEKLNQSAVAVRNMNEALKEVL
jgi:malate dehydrogenase